MGLDVGLSYHLYSYFVYVSRKGYGESVRMRMLARSFAARWCDISTLCSVYAHAETRLSLRCSLARYVYRNDFLAIE